MVAGDRLVVAFVLAVVDFVVVVGFAEEAFAGFAVADAVALAVRLRVS